MTGSLPVRLSDRKRLLILKSIRYAMDSASLWSFKPGPPYFELYLVCRSMMAKKKGRPLIWQGHLEPEEMRKEIDGWIEAISQRLEALADRALSSLEHASLHARSEAHSTDI